LIRQSEFRTVTGGNATYTNKVAEFLTVLAGVDYQRDAPRRLDLDHHASTDPTMYGPFRQVSANNLTLGDIASYFALDGTLTRRFRYYLGYRRDEIGFDNVDLLAHAHSFNRWIGVNSPKATLSFLPSEHSSLPFVSVSAGEAFFTNDPRIGTGSTQGTLVSRAHSYQLGASKTLAGTELRLTLGRVTTEASLVKIDPDTGLQFDEGPGRLRFMTVSARVISEEPCCKRRSQRPTHGICPLANQRQRPRAQSWMFLGLWTGYLFMCKLAVSSSTSARSHSEAVSLACQ
jgi:hypothetical protein